MIQYRQELEKRMQSVPNGHSRWSVQKAMDFKEFALKCQKALAKRTTQEQEFLSLIRQYDSFRGET